MLAAGMRVAAGANGGAAAAQAALVWTHVCSLGPTAGRRYGRLTGQGAPCGMQGPSEFETGEVSNSLGWTSGWTGQAGPRHLANSHGEP